MLEQVAADVGPLDEVSARAELLIAVAHETRDRDIWGGDRALTYWDRLPEKVRAACYAGPTLADWWQRITTTLGCTHPRTVDDRRALATALAAGDDRQVLDALRTRTEALCLRVRLAAQQRRDTRQPKMTADQEGML